MKPSEVLKQLREHREAYRKQGFSFTREQEQEYARLRKLRHERVQYLYENDMVFKGAKKVVEKKAEET